MSPTSWSPTAAAELYGVGIDADSLQVDEAATAALREQLRPTRLGRDPLVSGRLAGDRGRTRASDRRRRRRQHAASPHGGLRWASTTGMIFQTPGPEEMYVAKEPVEGQECPQCGTSDVRRYPVGYYMGRGWSLSARPATSLAVDVPEEADNWPPFRRSPTTGRPRRPSGGPCEARPRTGKAQARAAPPRRSRPICSSTASCEMPARWKRMFMASSPNSSASRAPAPPARVRLTIAGTARRTRRTGASARSPPCGTRRREPRARREAGPHPDLADLDHRSGGSGRRAVAVQRDQLAVTLAGVPAGSSRPVPLHRRPAHAGTAVAGREHRPRVGRPAPRSPDRPAGPCLAESPGACPARRGTAPRDSSKSMPSRSKSARA